MSIKRIPIKESKLWLFVYSDWITNLTLFFILIYASVLLALEKGLTAEEYKQQMQKISSATFDKTTNTQGKIQKLKDTLIQIEGIKIVTFDRKEMFIVLPEPILFDAGQAKVKDLSKPLLARIGNVIALIPAKVIVEGYATDLDPNSIVPADMPAWKLSVNRLTTGLGPYRSNWELSADRANKVVSFLLLNGGIEESRLIACAKGPVNIYTQKIGNESIKPTGIAIRIIFDKAL